jgi:hypothetical protein
MSDKYPQITPSADTIAIVHAQKQINPVQHVRVQVIKHETELVRVQVRIIERETEPVQVIRFRIA